MCNHSSKAAYIFIDFSLLPHRCFTFGIGSGASTALVEGLARAGNGSAEFIKGSERMQPKVSKYMHTSFYDLT